MSEKINILLSVKPQYANLIVTGVKTVELRKVRPKNLAAGGKVLIYTSSPVMLLVGEFRVKRIIEKPIDILWAAVKRGAGVTRDEYRAYFHGKQYGVALFIDEYSHYERPIGLQELRRRYGQHLPPQNFVYV